MNVLRMLIEALASSINPDKDEDAIETFFSLAHHNILEILFQILIALKEKVLTNYKNSQIDLLLCILIFFNRCLALKRVQKLLRNTEGFETISQPGFWEPICFSPNLPACVKVLSLWFSLRISKRKSFTENFVEKYVALAREHISAQNEKWSSRGTLQSISQIILESEKWSSRGTLQSISQIILESEQGEFLLKLVSDLSEKSSLIPSESQAEKMKCHRLFGNARAFVKCANCGVMEKSEKQFQKCSRCGFVFYCSKACQRNDWQNHKQICKEIKKEN